MADFIIIAVLLVITGFVLYRGYQNRKSGKSACGCGGCAGCSAKCAYRKE